MKKLKTKSISAGIAINIIAFALIKSVNIFTAPIMTEILSTNDYGVISIFNTWTGIIGLFAGLGVQGSLTNFRFKSEEKEYYHYCWNILWVGIIGHVILVLFFLPIRGIIANLIDIPEELILVMVFSAMFQFCASFLSTFFVIENLALYNAILSFVTVGGAFGLSLLFVSIQASNENLYIPFIKGHLIVNFALGLICIFYFGLKGRSKIRAKYIKYCLYISLPLVFHSLAGTVLGSSDRIMIQQMNDLSMAGVYSFTYNFASILSSIWYAINSIWTPFYFRFLKEGDVSNLMEKKRNFDFIYLMLTIGFILMYPEVFKLLANERYWEQIKIIPIIAIGFFANHMYSFPTNYETYCEKTKYVAVGTIGAAVVNIMLNFVLIPFAHETGAAIATMVSYISLFIFHLFISKKIIGNYPFKNALAKSYYLILIFAVCMFYLFFEVWQVRWGLAIIIGIILLWDIIKRRAIL